MILCWYSLACSLIGRIFFFQIISFLSVSFFGDFVTIFFDVAKNIFFVLEAPLIHHSRYVSLLCSCLCLTFVFGYLLSSSRAVCPHFVKIISVLNINFLPLSTNFKNCCQRLRREYLQLIYLVFTISRRCVSSRIAQSVEHFPCKQKAQDSRLGLNLWHLFCIFLACNAISCRYFLY